MGYAGQLDPAVLNNFVSFRRSASAEHGSWRAACISVVTAEDEGTVEHDTEDAQERGTQHRTNLFLYVGCRCCTWRWYSLWTYVAGNCCPHLRRPMALEDTETQPEIQLPSKVYSQTGVAVNAHRGPSETLRSARSVMYDMV